MTFTFNDGPVEAVGGFMNYCPNCGSMSRPPFPDDVFIEALGATGEVLEVYNLADLAPISTPGAVDDGAFRGISRDTNDIFAFRISGLLSVIDDLAFSRVDPFPDVLFTSLVSGPLRDNDGMFEGIDLDGDTIPDEGPLIGIGLPHEQRYAYSISIKNGGTLGDLTQLAFLDVIPDKFEFDPDGEDEADGIDGACGDGDCDGVVAGPPCTATISGPTIKKNQIDLRYIVVEADALARGATCSTTVYVATALITGGGKGKKATQTFEPSTCDSALTDGGGPITNPVILNQGVMIIEKDTDTFVSGPHGAIQLIPIGCP